MKRPGPLSVHSKYLALEATLAAAYLVVTTMASLWQGAAALGGLVIGALLHGAFTGWRVHRQRAQQRATVASLFTEQLRAAQAGIQPTSEETHR